MKNYRKYTLLIMFMACTGILTFGQVAQIINVENRESMTLNGVWKYIVDSCRLPFSQTRTFGYPGRLEQKGPDLRNR
jgi:hypothetical protein